MARVNVDRKKLSPVVHQLPIVSAHRLGVQIAHELVLERAGTGTE
jgi:hypothetical protein